MDVFGWWEKGTSEQGMITECCELQYRKRRAESYEYMQQADLPQYRDQGKSSWEDCVQAMSGRSQLDRKKNVLAEGTALVSEYTP